jgi:hypothetical protein
VEVNGDGEYLPNDYVSPDVINVVKIRFELHSCCIKYVNK